MKCPTCGEVFDDNQRECPRCASVDAGPVPDHLELADGGRLLLDKETVTLGRGSANDHVLSDTSISRRHARLQRLPNGWLLIDLGSSNGTWVNGDKVVVPYLLAEGDQILLGEQPMVFRSGTVALGPGGVGKRARVETVLGRSAYGGQQVKPPTDPPKEHPTGEQTGA